MFLEVICHHWELVMVSGMIRLTIELVVGKLGVMISSNLNRARQV